MFFPDDIAPRFQRAEGRCAAHQMTRHASLQQNGDVDLTGK